MAAIETQVVAVRERVGVWLDRDNAIIRIGGKDAAFWLNSVTTNSVLSLKSGQGQANAVLNRKGQILAWFMLQRAPKGFRVFVDASQVVSLLTYFDAHIFMEDAWFNDASASYDIIAVEGPDARDLLTGLFAQSTTAAWIATAQRLPTAPYATVPITYDGISLQCVAFSLSGEDGFRLVVPSGKGAHLLQRLAAAGAPCGAEEISAEAREILRIEAGLPRFGIDINGTQRLLETTLDREVLAEDKGCFPGQEVVAKQRAYSTLRQVLAGVILDTDQPVPEVGAPVFHEAHACGRVTSAVYSPTVQRAIALAYIDATYRPAGTRVQVGKNEYPGTVSVLPVYAAPSRTDRAQALYEQALSRFEQDAQDEDPLPVRLLLQAVAIAPEFEDAYESLGVVLHRHKRTDDAIAAMQALVALFPDCIMAHTNLSVFYAAKGMTHEAEQEGAKAAMLQFKQDKAVQRKERNLTDKTERARQTERERLAMFHEVLEIDPDDPVALFGAGSANSALGNYMQAADYFERALKTQKDYSAAYLNLGVCIERIGDTTRAVEVYRAGVEVASRKGDLSAMREMERHLRALSSGTTPHKHAS